jgi:hypothetical protein
VTDVCVVRSLWQYNIATKLQAFLLQKTVRACPSVYVRVWGNPWGKSVLTNADLHSPLYQFVFENIISSTEETSMQKAIVSPPQNRSKCHEVVTHARQLMYWK